MTKDMAIQAIATLSSGTIANLTKLRRYDEIDAWLNKVYDRILQAKDDAFITCENWREVLEALTGYHLYDAVDGAIYWSQYKIITR